MTALHSFLHCSLYTTGMSHLTIKIIIANNGVSFSPENVLTNEYYFAYNSQNYNATE